MLKSSKKPLFVALIVIAAIIVIVSVGFLINTFGLNSEKLEASLAGKTYSWTDEFAGIYTGYSCDITYTMTFLEDGTVRLYGKGKRVWKKGSNLYPQGKTETIDYDYITEFHIEGTISKPILKYIKEDGSEIKGMEIRKSHGEIVGIGNYSRKY